MRGYFTGEAPKRLENLPQPRNWRRTVRQAVARLIATAILSTYASAGSAAPTLKSKSAIGTVTVDGVIQVNGSPAISGQTLFSGSSIRTSTESESTLELGNLARLKLEAETSLMIESSTLGLSASLDEGALRAFVPAGVQAGIITPDARITTDASQPAAFNVRVDSCSTTLSVQAGQVKIRSANYERSLLAGETLSTGDAQLPSGTQHNLSNGKKVGFVIGIGGVIAILVIALTREEPVVEGSFGGTVAPSPR
jgi:ferric-dicitrate binding protein FerR (iron transport regulator)